MVAHGLLFIHFFHVLPEIKVNFDKKGQLSEGFKVENILATLKAGPLAT